MTLTKMACLKSEWYRLFTAAVVVASVELLSSTSTWALCTPTAGAGAPPAGTAVDCAGITNNQNSPNGYGDGTQDGLTVNIHVGAQVQGDRGLFLRENNTILNSGEVTGISGAAIVAASATINNSGVVSSPTGTAIVVNATISFPSVNYKSSITNFGTVSAAGGAIQVGEGIQAGTAEINNFGNIGATRAIAIYGPAMQGTVNNFGTIAGSESAVYLGGSTLTLFNYGVLTASSGKAVFVATGSATIFNAGTLTGNGAPAVFFGSAHNTLTLAPSSVINGVVAAGITDTLQLGGTGNGVFDVSLIGAGQQYQGFGIFNKVDASTWTLTGSGAQAWTISQGTLVGDTNSLNGAHLTNHAALVLNQSFNGVLAATISGTGSLAKEGNGTVTLTGTNSYTGTTTINDGVLKVDGSTAFSALTTVNAGGTLGGNGIIGNTMINGGSLSPGNSIGTLTVQGSLVFTVASIYMVEMSPAAVDRTNVTGAATLGGATVSASFATVASLANQYTILHADSVSGTFAEQVNTNLPANFKASLSYDENNVYLNLTAALGAQQLLSGNQQNVANSINGFFNGGGTPPPRFATLFGLTGDSLSSALSQISGEAATGSQQTTFDAMNLFMGLLTDPFIAGRGDGLSAGGSAPNGYASVPKTGGARDAYAMFTKAPPVANFEQRWSVWAAGFGGSQTTSGNTVLGSNDTTSRIYASVAGADYRFSPNTIAGFALAGGGTNFAVANAGSGRSDLFQAGTFIRHTIGAAYLTGALAYGWQDISTDRVVTVAGFDRLRAQFTANAWSGRVEGGYRFVSPWIGGVGITPYAAEQFTTFDLPAYAEQSIVGTSTFALAYAPKSVTATRSELGLRGDKSFAMADGIVTLRGRFAWAHDFNPDRYVAATFQALPGASFIVNGTTMATDAALVTAAVGKKWLNGWSAAASFEGDFSKATTSCAGKGIVSYVW